MVIFERLRADHNREHDGPTGTTVDPVRSTLVLTTTTVSSSGFIHPTCDCRVSSRAHNTSRLVFKAYHFEQIQDILKHRLAELSLEGFDATVREFVARKAANVGGASQLQNLGNSTDA
jgi:Cdc6-like AAA superfamily ATPase